MEQLEIATSRLTRTLQGCSPELFVQGLDQIIMFRGVAEALAKMEEPLNISGIVLC